MLRQALADLRGRGAAPTYLRVTARSPWRDRTAADAAARIHDDSDDARAWPYSFVSICHVLGLDPDGIRRALAGRRAA